MGIEYRSALPYANLVDVQKLLSAINDTATWIAWIGSMGEIAVRHRGTPPRSIWTEDVSIYVDAAEVLVTFHIFTGSQRHDFIEWLQSYFES